MDSKAQPQPAPAVGSVPSPPSSGRRLALLALLVLLVGAGVETTLWLRRTSRGETGEPSDHRPDSVQGQLPACSDDDDPKTLPPLAFGPPLHVPFDRHPLDALAERPIPAVEVYPWQPEGLVAVLGEHRMRGSLFAVHPDGKLLAVAAGDNLIRFGALDTLHEKDILTCPANVVVLAWSPDGQTLAVSGGDGMVRLFDVREPGKVPAPVALEKPAAGITSLSWSGDGKYLLGGESTPNAATASVWEIQTRNIVSRLAHSGPVMGVAFSPVSGDYRALTSGGAGDGRLCLWDARDDKKPRAEIQLVPKTDTRTSLGGVAFSPDGKRALLGHPDGSVRLWDLDRFEKGKETHTLAGHAGTPLGVFAPDGRSVATARFGDGGVYLWSVSEGKQVRRLANSGGVYSLRFLPGGDRLIFAGTVSAAVDVDAAVPLRRGSRSRPVAGRRPLAECQRGRHGLRRPGAVSIPR